MVTGNSEISLSELYSVRLNMTCIIFNSVVTLLSIPALIAVVKRRRELFSIFTIFSILIVSAANGWTNLRV